jgi:hypothetical protein
MSNPYKELGQYEPFNLFGIDFMLAEAFKKVMCAGINGRAKDFQTDIKEAIYSLTRALECKQTPYRKLFDVELCIEKYVEVLDINVLQALAGEEIMFFVMTGAKHHLVCAIKHLDLLAKDSLQ